MDGVVSGDTQYLRERSIKVADMFFPRLMKLGPGSVLDLGDVPTSLDVDRPLLVTDAFMVSNGSAERLTKIAEAAGKSVAVFSETVPDPTTDSLQAGLDAVEAHRAGAIIGFGGGSPMDTAKALAVLSRSDGVMSDFKAPRGYAGPDRSSFRTVQMW